MARSADPKGVAVGGGGGTGVFVGRAVGGMRCGVAVGGGVLVRRGVADGNGVLLGMGVAVGGMSVAPREA